MQQDTTTETEMTSYHWIMTIQTGATFNTRDAVVEVPSGHTRQEIFKFVLDQFEDDYGTVAVLFFDLQPNQL